jgi:putative transposase
MLKNARCGRDIRHHLDKINDFDTLESPVNLALQSQVLPRIKKRKLKLAIDLNLIPYYGEPSDSEKPYIYRSQAKQGTCSFYAYATLYGSSLLFMLNQQTRCQDNILLTQKFRKFLKP